MVTTPARPEIEAQPAASPVEPSVPFKLILPPDWDPTDEALIELARINEPWDFELTADRELVFVAPEGLGSSARGVELIHQVAGWSSSQGGGIVFGPQMGARLPDSSMKMPDVAWVSDERWSNRDLDELSFLQGAPDFVVEIVSKSDALEAQEKKMAEWLANGVSLGWLIDPFREVATVYRPNVEPERLGRPVSLSGESVCRGLAVTLERVWK